MILNIAQDKVLLVVLNVTEAFIEANMANSHYNLLVRKIHLEKQRRLRTCVCRIVQRNTVILKSTQGRTK